MFPARVAFAKAEEDAQARDGDDCFRFLATLRVFQKATAVNPSSVELKTITSQEIHVLNHTDKEITVGQEFLVAETVDERWVVIGSGEGAPRFQFLTTGPINNRQVQAKVLRIASKTPDLSGGFLSVGDTVTLNDPFNLRADIDSNATGWAYLAKAQDDDPDTTEIDEQHVARYEIEDCSLPTNEIRGYLTGCLYRDTVEIEVLVPLAEYNNPVTGLYRSPYPTVDDPSEELTPLSNHGYSITAYNDFNMHGIVESEVVIRRVTDRQFSDPENYTTPKAKSHTHTQERWQIVQVAKPFASFIKVVYTYSGGWQPSGDEDAVYDGYWPPENVNPPYVTCEPTITCDLCECLPTGPDDGEVQGYAHFDGLGGYKVTSTKSAFYGNGETVNIDEILGFSGCNLNFNERPATVFCLGDPTLRSVSLPVSPVNVVAAPSLYMNNVCDDSCKWEVRERECPDGPDPEWTWDESGQQWVLSNNDACESCTSGEIRAEYPPTDGEFNGATTTTRCVELYWRQVGFCYDSDCSCGCSPPALTSASAAGDIHTCSCTGTPTGDVQLCFGYSLQTIQVIDCGGSGIPDPVPQTPICIDTEECVYP